MGIEELTIALGNAYAHTKTCHPTRSTRPVPSKPCNVIPDISSTKFHDSHKSYVLQKVRLSSFT